MSMYRWQIGISNILFGWKTLRQVSNVAIFKNFEFFTSGWDHISVQQNAQFLTRYTPLVKEKHWLRCAQLLHKQAWENAKMLQNQKLHLKINSRRSQFSSGEENGIILDIFPRKVKNFKNYSKFMEKLPIYLFSKPRFRLNIFFWQMKFSSGLSYAK